MKEGDLLFFRERNFKSAQSKYREALAVKYDESVRDKIADCENNLKEQSQLNKREEIPVNKEKIKQEPQILLKRSGNSRQSFPQ
ncbi:MAG: hypothetical protein WDO19_04760 [Bacteroidota bacterium]